VTNLVGNIEASGLTDGTLDITTSDNTNDNGIAITTGTWATSVTGMGADDTITINAASLLNGSMLTLDGVSDVVVTNLVGNIQANALTEGTLDVTTSDNLADNTISITTGLWATSVTGTGTDDVISIFTSSLSNDSVLTLDGNSNVMVTGLVADIEASGLTDGTLDITTSNNTADNDIFITTGTWATSVTGTAVSDTISIFAASLLNNTVLTLDGQSTMVVTNLVGDIEASGMTGGTLDITTSDNTADNGISITTGIYATSVTGTGTNDLITINVGSLLNDSVLTLDGLSNVLVTNLVGDIVATGLTDGTLDITTSDNTGDNDIFITTGTWATSVTGMGTNDTISVDASSLLNGSVLTLDGLSNLLVTNLIGNIEASGLTDGTLDITTSDNTNDNTISITTGAWEVSITAAAGSDTISVNADALLDNRTMTIDGASHFVVTNMEGQLDASGLTGTLSVSFSNVTDNAASITTGTANTTLAGFEGGNDTLSVNAELMADNTTLTISGSSDSFTIDNLLADLTSTATGTISVTLDDDGTDATTPAVRVNLTNNGSGSAIDVYMGPSPSSNQSFDANDTISLSGTDKFNLHMTTSQHNSTMSILGGSALDEISITDGNTSGTMITTRDQIEVYQLSNSGNYITQSNDATYTSSLSIVGANGIDALNMGPTLLTDNMDLGGDGNDVLILGGAGNDVIYSSSDDTLRERLFIDLGATGVNVGGTDVVLFQNAAIGGAGGGLGGAVKNYDGIGALDSNDSSLEATILLWDSNILDTTYPTNGTYAAEVTGFTSGSGGDKIGYLYATTKVTAAGFAENVVPATFDYSLYAPNSVIELSANVFQMSDPNNLAAIAYPMKALGNIANGSYYIVAYSGTDAGADAYIYAATATEGDGFDFADVDGLGGIGVYDTDTVELIGIIRGIGANTLTGLNFV